MLFPLGLLQDAGSFPAEVQGCQALSCAGSRDWVLDLRPFDLTKF